ncbi:hypothetical protein KSP40_PGU014589 [Platanthera guangdongensis]|uniref:Amine oxidase domain-containing protein n=1 Tax=Platanthera guangdongensis TaxID=2320717 RepID=A0ABR2MAF4_9ASPA
MAGGKIRRVAVVGAGITGLAAAYELVKAGLHVTLYEMEDHLGGHQARTVTIDGVDLHLAGVADFNPISCQNMMESFEKLAVEMEIIDMSISVSFQDDKYYEWGSRNGLRSLFAHKGNIMNPYVWYMLKEIFNFKENAFRYLKEHDENLDLDRGETLELFLKFHGYSQLFQTLFLIPICASIWSCSLEGVKNFSAYSILSFFRNNHLLQPNARLQSLTARCLSENYMKKVREELESRCCRIIMGCAVQSVSSNENGCSVITSGALEELYDECIITTSAPDALKILGSQKTYEESRILGSFQYAYRNIYLHCDGSFMPQNQSAWSARNFRGSKINSTCLTYWLNAIQKLGSTGRTFLVTLNPPFVPKNKILEWTTSYPLPSVAASKASLELENIQGRRGIWFCGSYQGYGFQEDGIKVGIVIAQNLLRNGLKLLKNTNHMTPSLMETGARLVVTKFLQDFISIGSLILLEDGGSPAAFGDTNKPNDLKSVIKVHSPLFYWKIAAEADMGLAAAYINGYFSFVNQKEGLLDLFLLLIANRELRNASSINQNKRGWWTPLFLTAGVASAAYFFKHMSMKNTVSQARHNISQHYDVGNDFFSIFLDETMQYSCPIFKNANEDLKDAQLHKIHVLINKANIVTGHEILEIGCGWGSLAIEVVKMTGCKYTGITLSIEQLQFSKRRVEEAGLEDKITLLLCDYRQLSFSRKYDRIISCEMIEAVGHEYMDDYFSCCEKLLAKDGLLIMQFISIPDQQYDKRRRTPGFITEFIFPGGCLPSLNRVTSAMAASSKLCVQQVESIGIHYYQALMIWRTSLMANKDKISALGFDEKFIRTWEYYFVYCAAAFKTRHLGDYQIVFSRPGNVKVFNDPYKGISSAY